MNEKKSSRKDWVKNALIAFLAVMLVLTFFSNTIMNYSLPEVAAQYTQSGTITTKVRGSGTVESGSLYNVMVTESRKVTSLEVRVGDTVAIGDVICHLDDTESAELKSARNALEAAEQAYDTALLAGDLNSSVLQNGGNAASTTNYRNQLIEAQAKVDNIQALLDGMMENYNSKRLIAENADLKLQEAQNNLNNINSWLSYQQDLSGGNASAISTLNDQRLAAQQVVLQAQNTANAAALELSTLEQQKTSLETQLADAKSEVSTLATNINATLNLSALKDAVDEAQAEVDRLEDKAIGATVTAEVAGTITSVNVVAGENTSPDMAVATIQPEGKGFTLSFSVTNEQAKRISVGDPGELVNSWYYNDVTATVTSIRPDTQNPSSNKLITFALSGDLTAGQTLNLQVGQKSASYDTIVPNSAIREDNNGKFVLVVESRPSPLGTRYYAVRYTVEVLASDDTQSAVAGLESYTYVITTSTKPVEAGQLVRLQD